NRIAEGDDRRRPIASGRDVTLGGDVTALGEGKGRQQLAVLVILQRTVRHDAAIVRGNVTLRADDVAQSPRGDPFADAVSEVDDEVPPGLDHRLGSGCGADRAAEPTGSGYGNIAVIGNRRTCVPVGSQANHDRRLAADVEVQAAGKVG